MTTDINNYHLIRMISNVESSVNTLYNNIDSIQQNIKLDPEHFNVTNGVITLNSTTSDRQLVISPVSTGFKININSPSSDPKEQILCTINKGKVDFQYNIVSVENISIAGNSIQNIIKTNQNPTPISTDYTLYTASKVDEKFATKDELNALISRIEALESK